MNWFYVKQRYSAQLSAIYEQSEANNILQILAEELLPHYNKFQFKDSDFSLTEHDITLLDKAYVRLLNHEPLQYIIEKAWFYDITLNVNSYVLIPRPETEELVDLIIKDHPHFKGSILDIGTGSGCIPLTLKKHLPEASVSAVDVDENALGVAKENSQELKLDVHFHVMDILDEAAQNSLEQFDIIVSNPPYIPMEEKGSMHENVLGFEPHIALFVENDKALLFYETIAAFALKRLNKQGKLYFECNEFNAQEVKAMLEEKHFKNVQVFKDLQGKDRMIKAGL